MMPPIVYIMALKQYIVAFFKGLHGRVFKEIYSCVSKAIESINLVNATNKRTWLALSIDYNVKLNMDLGKLKCDCDPII